MFPCPFPGRFNGVKGIPRCPFHLANHVDRVFVGGTVLDMEQGLNNWQGARWKALAVNRGQ